MELALGLTVVRTSVDLTLMCIKTVTSSAQGIYGLITALNSSSVGSISHVLRELDLETDVLILESLLKEIDVDKHHTETLSLCLKSLEECVLKIETALKTVHERISYNNSIWLFSTMRSYSFDDLADSLKILKLNLNNRKKTLFDVIKINPFLKCTSTEINNLDNKQSNDKPIDYFSIVNS